KAYQRARSRSPSALLMMWEATRVLFASAAFRMRESIKVVIFEPSGCKGGTACAYGFTATWNVLKKVVLGLSGLLMRTTLMCSPLGVRYPVSLTSHIGSPATESCITAGRRLASTTS